MHAIFITVNSGIFNYFYILIMHKLYTRGHICFIWRYIPTAAVTFRVFPCSLMWPHAGTAKGIVRCERALCVCLYYVCVLYVLWGANCSWAATAKQQQNQQQQQQQQWLVVVCKSSFKINADCRNKRRSEQLTWNQSKGSPSKRSSAKAKKTKWWAGGGQESLAATVAEQLQWQQKCTEMDRQNAHITRKHIHAVLATHKLAR